MEKTLALVLTAALTVMALSGCGSKETDTTTQTQAAAEQTTAAGETAAVGGAFASVGTLKLAVTTGDGSTTDDEIPTPWYNRIMATNLMYRALLLADSTLTEMTPDLADTYTVGNGDLVCTIILRGGLKWSDGQDLTIDDVQFSIETGLKAVTINSIYMAAFKNIKDIKTNDSTITLTLSEPYAAILNVLVQFAVLPKHSLENTDPLNLESDPFWTNPVTSGMYALDKLSVGNYFTLKRNENYEGTAPRIDKVICYFVSDYMTAVQAGNIDYVSGNVAGLVGTLQGISDSTAHEVDVLFYEYFISNMKGIGDNENPTIQNMEVHGAIMEAIDRATLATLCPNANMLNNGVPNSSPTYNGFEYKFDAERAKADLTTSGYNMNRILRICCYNSDQTNIGLINTVVYYLEQAGLKMEATLSDDGAIDLFTTRVYDIGFKDKSTFSTDGWYTEYISSNGLLANIFGGDTDFDGLAVSLSKAVDESSRNRILKKLQDMGQEKVYKVPVFTIGTYIFTSNNVTIPGGMEFCNPLCMSGLDFTN